MVGGDESTGRARLGFTDNTDRFHLTHQRRFFRANLSARRGVPADHPNVLRLRATRFFLYAGNRTVKVVPTFSSLCRFNRSAVRLDDGLADGKAQAGVAAGARLVGAVKSLEYTRQIAAEIPGPVSATVSTASPACASAARALRLPPG